MDITLQYVVQSIIGRPPCKLVVSLYQRHHATKYSEHSTELRFYFKFSCVDLHCYQWVVIMDLFCLRTKDTISKKFPFVPLETKTFTRVALYFNCLDLKNRHYYNFRYAAVNWIVIRRDDLQTNLCTLAVGTWLLAAVGGLWTRRVKIKFNLCLPAACQLVSWLKRSWRTYG